MGFLDWLNPWTMRADRRGNRELTLAEDRARYERSAVLGARYEDGPPEPFEPVYAMTLDAVVSGHKRVEHSLLVNCAGPHPARDTHVWLAYGDGQVPRTEELHLGLLGDGDERKVEFEESEFPGGCVPRDGWLMCRWTDGLGTHTERLLDLTVYL